MPFSEGAIMLPGLWGRMVPSEDGITHNKGGKKPSKDDKMSSKSEGGTMRYADGRPVSVPTHGWLLVFGAWLIML